MQCLRAKIHTCDMNVYYRTSYVGNCCFSVTDWLTDIGQIHECRRTAAWLPGKQNTLICTISAVYYKILITIFIYICFVITFNSFIRFHLKIERTCINKTLRVIFQTPLSPSGPLSKLAQMISVSLSWWSLYLTKIDLSLFLKNDRFPE